MKQLRLTACLVLWRPNDGGFGEARRRGGGHPPGDVSLGSPRGRFRAWLMRIVRNRCLNRIESQRRRRRVLAGSGLDVIEPVSREPVPSARAEADEERTRVEAAIRNAAQASGMRTMLADGLERAARGATSVREVIRVVPPSAHA